MFGFRFWGLKIFLLGPEFYSTTSAEGLGPEPSALVRALGMPLPRMDGNNGIPRSDLVQGLTDAIQSSQSHSNEEMLYCFIALVGSKVLTRMYTCPHQQWYKRTQHVSSQSFEAWTMFGSPAQIAHPKP